LCTTIFYIYIYIIILAIQHNGDVTLKKKVDFCMQSTFFFQVMKYFIAGNLF